MRGGVQIDQRAGNEGLQDKRAPAKVALPALAGGAGTVGHAVPTLFFVLANTSGGFMRQLDKQDLMLVSGGIGSDPARPPGITDVEWAAFLKEIEWRNSNFTRLN